MTPWRILLAVLVTAWAYCLVDAVVRGNFQFEEQCGLGG